MIDDLVLETNSEIYIPQINEFIHQPTIGEIAYITQGEVKFFEILNDICKTVIDIDTLGKENKLTDEQLKVFSQISSFEYFVSLSAKNIYLFISLKLLFKVFFPSYSCNLEEKTDEDGSIKIFLELTPKDDELRKKIIIDKENYDIVINYIKEICCVNRQERVEKEPEFNPVNEKARQIAEKIMAGRKTIEEIKSKQNKSEYFLAKMINLLRGTGSYSTSELNNMSIYQLIQTHKRNTLYDAKKEQVTYHAGGFEIKEFIDWAKDMI